MKRAWIALVGLFLVVGCSSGGKKTGPQPMGYVLPTVAGRQASTFTNGIEAREAFTRRAGSLQATLEDAVWLRYAGDPETVAKDHCAYFDYGYTTFQVETHCKEFVQPTSETFILEDSCGARLTGSPLCYDSSPRLIQGRFFTAFTLSFRHTLTKDIRWIRLRWPKPADGSTLEWRFDEEPCPPGQTPPAAAPACAPPPCDPPPCAVPCAPPAPTFAPPPRATQPCATPSMLSSYPSPGVTYPTQPSMGMGSSGPVVVPSGRTSSAPPPPPPPPLR